MVQVIFLENIENNKVGDVKNVPDGYARNFLLKKGLAVLATEEEMKKIEARLEKIKKEEEKKVKSAEELAEKIGKAKVRLEMQVGEEGKLFGSVTNRDVAEKLSEIGFEIDKANIEFPETIHTKGKHAAHIKLGHGVAVDIEIEVVQEV
ncbi:50S ribosomal protein L9 [candidate division WS5 bacterium]|uniref:Large ribosomal subunit protein bL9 n=1 Tax=candidate division WS5 bacterium TaxID=2093353 RepID=A0A419DA27_9BACT|nr:MAG: 50S ribosomal protein L9 [candidate division WS5 bacterium]